VSEGVRPRRLPLDVLVATIAAAVLIPGALASMRLQPDDAIPAALLAALPQWLWPVLPLPAALTAASQRRWWAAALNAALALAATLTLGGLCLPAFAGSAGGEDVRRVRLVTWNVRYEEWRTGSIDRTLRSFHPDIVCLQETDEREFANLLLGWNRADCDEVLTWGLRVHSRHPISRVRTVGRRGPEIRPSLVCRVEVPGAPVTVACVHLTSSLALGRARDDDRGLAAVLVEGARARHGQLEDLLGELPDGPLIVAGDHNTPPGTSLHRRMAARMTDAYAAEGLGFGYTILARDLVPLKRIDYIWCAGGVLPETCHVGRAYPSDHRPVIADVLVPSAHAP